MLSYKQQLLLSHLHDHYHVSYETQDIFKNPLSFKISVLQLEESGFVDESWVVKGRFMTTRLGEVLAREFNRLANGE